MTCIAAPTGRPADDDDCGGIMPEYRRRKESTVWHWCRNCAKWPLADFESVYTKPATGELDRECREKEEAGDCRNY